jgi:hypothetical protein
MSEYLQAAANLLAKAAAENEQRNARAMSNTYIEINERLAKGYALLSAIDRGVLPPSVAEGMYAHLAQVAPLLTR